MPTSLPMPSILSHVHSTMLFLPFFLCFLTSLFDYPVLHDYNASVSEDVPVLSFFTCTPY